jgi:hypothetical protein
VNNRTCRGRRGAANAWQSSPYLLQPQDGGCSEHPCGDRPGRRNRNQPGKTPLTKSIRDNRGNSASMLRTRAPPKGWDSCPISQVFIPIPKGLCPGARGCPACGATLGFPDRISSTLQGLCPLWTRPLPGCSLNVGFPWVAPRTGQPRALGQNPVGVHCVPISAPSHAPTENAERINRIPPDSTRNRFPNPLEGSPSPCSYRGP